MEQNDQQPEQTDTTGSFESNAQANEPQQPGSESNVQGGGQADNKQDDQNEVLMGVLAYIGILFIIPLLVAKESAFAQYHAKQGAVLFVAEVATVFFTMIPILGWILGPVIWIVWFIFAVIGIINAVQKKQKPLPLIGEFAKHF